MRVVDTNLVVRILVDDDPAQTRRARQVFERGDVLVLASVVLESVWVLRSLYRLPPQRIASILRGLLGLPGVIAEHPAKIARAMERFETGLDFADALHLAAVTPGSEFITFDRALARRSVGLVGAAQVRLA